MQKLWEIGFMILASYLVGSIPFGVLIARSRGVDIFKEGSGNIGATNIGRVLGYQFGLLVFALDFLKGALPVFIVQRFSNASATTSTLDSLEPITAGLAAFLGHLFPAYLRFRGGKGIATGAGVVSVLLPLPTLAAVSAWIVVLLATRYVSLSSIIAALVLCLAEARWISDPLMPPHLALTIFCWLASALVFFRHRTNIVRLVQGNENRIRQGGLMLQFSKVIHVLALGLWFGTLVFFIIAALVIFESFEALADSNSVRPPALPLPTALSKDQADQLAGIAIGPLFDWYFAMQGVCAVLALATAVGWHDMMKGARIHRYRIAFLMAAFALVVIGWPLARYVGKLRIERFADDPAMAETARQAFATWHAVSLGLNMGTLVFVTLAMALVATMPTETLLGPVSQTRSEA
jgi:acyl-phosphate glycerol 3-phosphate acyltransferase